MSKNYFSQTLASLPAPEKNVGRSILKRFLLLFVLLTVAFLGVSFPVYMQYENGIKEQLLAKEEVSVVSAVQMFQKEMYEQLHMLDLIIQSHTLKEYLAEGTAEQQLRVEGIFENISTSFHRFDQIRLLDNVGQEKIRVNLNNGRAELIAQEELQNKAQRYYFKATQQMQPGQIYISAMDLNIEQELIEIPYKPTLRFATPLKDAQGNQAGVLVINYLAKGMLVRFRQLMNQRPDQQGMLIDSRGYWLSNHERGNEWGADLGRPEHSFLQFYPDIWPVIVANRSGIKETKAGIFRYQSVEPLNFLDSQPTHFRMEHHPLLAEESYANTDWKLVIFLPREIIDAHSFLYQPLGRTLFALIILMIAGIAFLAAHLMAHRKLRQQKAQQAQALLEHQASIDVLTGIRNRRRFYEDAELEFMRARRQGQPLAALMLDADYFKKVNDSYGHDVGDLVLKNLAQTMAQTLRGIDLLGRVGGEEFALLLPQTHLDAALEVAERLRLTLEECAVPLPEGGSIHFTVSLGLAMLTPEDHRFSDLLKKADLALYQAKQQGRNRVVVYLRP